MLMVLSLHADFLSIGTPLKMDFLNDGPNAWARTVFESFSIVSVNIFVLISGWFGIRTTIKGVAKYLFQCLYFTMGIWFIFILIGSADVFPSFLYNFFFCYYEYWFVRSYLLLYLLAPMLNQFIKTSSKRVAGFVISSFLLFQIIYGFTCWDPTLNRGYSTISFIWLYLLARFIKQYNLLEKAKILNWSIIMICCIILNSVLFYIVTVYEINLLSVYAYNNPVIILQSVSILVIFSKIQFGVNSLINWISISCFAVYLGHINPYILPWFKSVVLSIYLSFDKLACVLALMLYIVIVFIISILLDQPRIWLWNLISKSSIWEKYKLL